MVGTAYRLVGQRRSPVYRSGVAYGQPVRAAASGKVVYSGSSLPGYGQLLIIKHNEDYLSAYGHNQTIAVKEGDRVATGQRIATMGNGPKQRPMLHFEIRTDGKPVDPLRFLPRK